MPSSDDDLEVVAHDAAPPRLFGRWLVDNGIIDEAALAEALELMSLVNRTVGEMATAKGLLTEAQAEYVAALQAQVDAQWGSIALATGLGSLTPLALDQLVAEQAANNLRLSDALVELEHLSAEEADRWWARYTAECSAIDPLAWLPDPFRSRSEVRAVLRMFPRFAVRTLGLPMRLGAPRPWSHTPAAAAVAAAVELQRLHLGLIVHQPTKLQPEDIRALLRTVAWHATRGSSGASANGTVVHEPSEMALPPTGVAIDAVLGDDRCTIVIGTQEPDAWCH